MNNGNRQIVQAMIARGNSPGLIRELLEKSAAWAEATSGPDAAAVRVWLQHINFARPFYSAAALAHIWPAIRHGMGLELRMSPPPSPNRLANELKFHGLPIVRRADQIGDWFPNGGQKTEFFICEQIGKWRDARLTPEQFEEIQNARD